MNIDLPYTEAVQKVAHEMNTLDISKRPDLVKRYVRFSANLQYFRPEINPEKHEALWNELCLNQYLSHLDQNHPEVLEHVLIKNQKQLLAGPLTVGPGIICTYHTGSYRLINKWLMLSGIPYISVVAGDVPKHEQHTYYQIFNELCPDATVMQFNTIDAQHPKSAVRLLRALKEGYKLLIYADGNTGTGLTQNKEKQSAVRFYNKPIWVRNGIGALAYWAQCPVHILSCKRLSLFEMAFDVQVPVYADLSLHRNKSGTALMQQIYSYLEKQIKDAPAQWEGWLHLHKHADIPHNQKLYIPLHLQEYLMNDSMSRR